MLYWSRKTHSLYHMVDERPRKMSMVNWSSILGFARSKPHRHYFRYYRNWVMEKKKLHRWNDLQIFNHWIIIALISITCIHYFHKIKVLKLFRHDEPMQLNWTFELPNVDMFLFLSFFSPSLFSRKPMPQWSIMHYISKWKDWLEWIMRRERE